MRTISFLLLFSMAAVAQTKSIPDQIRLSEGGDVRIFGSKATGENAGFRIAPELELYPAIGQQPQVLGLATALLQRIAELESKIARLEAAGQAPAGIPKQWGVQSVAQPTQVWTLPDDPIGQVAVTRGGLTLLEGFDYERNGRTIRFTLQTIRAGDTLTFSYQVKSATPAAGGVSP